MFKETYPAFCGDNNQNNKKKKKNQTKRQLTETDLPTQIQTITNSKSIRFYHSSERERIYSVRESINTSVLLMQICAIDVCL